MNNSCCIFNVSRVNIKIGPQAYGINNVFGNRFSLCGRSNTGCGLRPLGNGEVFPKTARLSHGSARQKKGKEDD